MSMLFPLPCKGIMILVLISTHMHNNFQRKHLSSKEDNHGMFRIIFITIQIIGQTTIFLTTTIMLLIHHMQLRSRTNLIPLIPFSQRLHNKKLEKQYEKFLQTFQQLHINIPFADALAQMPLYAKFLKEMLSRKRKLEDVETITLNAECSAVFKNQFGKN